MRPRFIGSVLLAAAVPLAGCAPPGRAPIEPAAAPTVSTIATPATATSAAQRMAFANERYRAQIFPGAARFVPDPVYATQPDLVSGTPTPLSMTIYTPSGDTVSQHPAIVWIHGGGFTTGTRDEMGQTAIDYARLGYVTATIDYRLDPTSHCIFVQLGVYDGNPAQKAAELARCKAAIFAARDDAALAIAWLRAHAVNYGVDPTRIAVGGASAGAITAIHVGETLNTPGSPPPAASRVSAVLAMSGCNYVDLYVGPSIDSFDAPIAVLASGGDFLVPFACVTHTADAAEAAGAEVVRNYYPAESAHAQALYAAHQAEVDRAWRQFLIDAFGLS